jgi:flagellar biosynthesis protein FlhA
MIVTRAGNSSSFNDEMPRQLSQNPTALMISGATVLLLMLIPGFPKPVMIVLGGVLLWMGYFLQNQNKKAETQARYQAEQAALAAQAAEAGTTAPPGAAEDYYRDANNIFNMLPLDQIEMDFGYSLLKLVDEKSGGNFIERLVLFRKDFAMQMGMVFPSVRMRNNPDINPNQYVIKIRGEEVARAEILNDHFLALDNGDVSSPVDGIDTIEPAFGIPARWISADKKVAASVAGYTLIDPVSVMVTHLSEIVKKYCHEILTRQDVNIMIQNIKKNNPSLVDDIIPNIITVGYLQRILSMLLKEGIPIRDMETILETLSENAYIMKDIDIMVEQVRQGLKRTISRRFAEGDSIRVIMLDPKLENYIMKNIKKTDRAGSLAADPAATQKIVDNTRDATDKVRDVLPNVVILSAPVVRVYFKRLIEQYVKDVSVLSYNELEPSITIQAVAYIGL